MAILSIEEIRSRCNALHPDDPEELLGALYDAHGQHMAALEEIHRNAGDHALLASEQKKFDAHIRERDALDREIDAVTIQANAKQAARLKNVEASRAKWGSNYVAGPSYTSTAVEPWRLSSSEARTAALRHLDNAKHLSARQGDHLDALLRSTAPESDGGVVSKLVCLTETPEYRSAFQRVLLDPHPVLSGAEADALRAVQEFRAMALGDGTSAYGVPALIDPTIILTDQQSGNPFWRLATVKSITNDKWRGVSSAGVSWSWDAEAEEVSDDSPTLVQPEVAVHMARGFVPYSFEIGMDYPGFAQEMARLLAEGYSELTAEAFATGGGVTAPKGILTALDANTNVEVSVTTAGQFTATDIDKLWNALPDRAKNNATWLLNPSVATHIGAWGDAFGGRTVDLTGVPQSLRGRPIVESSHLPVFTSTTGSLSILIVGDFSKFVIAQRAGMAVEAIPHLFGTTNGLPTGQRGLFAWARVGSGTSDDTAFRLLNNGS